MTPDVARDIITTTAIATIYAIVGVIALGAALRLSRPGRTATLLLAWAMLQHSINQAMGGGVPQALGTSLPAARWVAAITGYFIAVPWALLLEHVLGLGWRSSVRITAVAFIAFASWFTALDIVRGEPGTSAAFSRAVVAAGAVVAFGNLFVMRGAERMRLQVLRAGILAFMALVVHDAVARSGMLPWRAESGAWAVLICVVAIGYTVVSETLRRRGELRAMEHELATARRIQSSLLPDRAPALEGATVVFRYVPAAAVAGDVFDFLVVKPRSLGILVADVSGHGVPAALIASMVKVATAAQKLHADDPARVLAGIHLAIADELPPAHFVTASYVHVDLDGGLVRLASAGHPPPLVWRRETRTFAPSPDTGPLIIAFAPPVYPVSEIPLGPGDRVIIYTDGITEAMRPDGEMFGVERLREIAGASWNGPDGLASAAVEAAVSFRGRRVEGLEDDCTLVVLEVTP